MTKRTGVVVTWATSICLAAMSLCGCTRDADKTPDPVVEKLRSLVPQSPAAKERIDLAISLRQNAVIDSQPVLLYAYVRDDADFGDGQPSFVVGLGFYDEDKDVIGCAVREERTTHSGSRETFVESYPVFTHYPMDGTLQFRSFPIQVRTSDQRKDDQQWQKYIEAHTLDEKSVRNRESFARTLPPVYVSIPEPNHTDVMVYLYDRGGHESNTLQLPHAQTKKDR
jgi:hypothetical protein